jgi:hypothetical protein
MKRIRKTIAASVAGLGALILIANPGLAGAAAEGPGQLAHMSQGQSGGTGTPGMMGQGMGPGMMGQGMRSGSGATMPCPGASERSMGPGKMGPEVNPGTMKTPGAGHHSMRVVPRTDLSLDDVRHFFADRLAMHDNKRLRVGEVKEGEDDTITADIETVDGSLVQRFGVDRHSGAVRQVE